MVLKVCADLYGMTNWHWNFLSWFPSFWNFRIVMVDNNPITLGKILTGLCLLVMGYFICKSVAKEIEKRLLSHLEIEASLRYTLRTIIFYILLIVLTLFVLRLLNVPITVFTVLGGALAIGVGLGSQNIVNNFISGIVIMLEGPVRVGDVIEIEGLYGVVEHIGARSTRVKSLKNTHIVVPNSSFLEKNVFNWTLSDDVVRAVVKVGVAYDSPAAKVALLLREAALTHPQVLRQPEPLVIFADFAESCLKFEVYFWTQVPNNDIMRLWAVESEIRFAVERLFRENDIVMSFPQRDVHLDALRPIPVEFVKSSG